ncbi:MAG: AAA family ATPase [archaeon]|jgi:predicted ATPase
MKKTFVITGAAATGKTTLIEELRKLNINCQDELARVVINEELEKKSDLVPWINLEGFNEILLAKFIAQHSSLSEDLQFLDRGIPDIIGYLQAAKKPVHEKFNMAAKKYRYSNKVFFTEPWKEIYVTDNARREPFEQNVKISDALMKSYIDAGYDLICIPKLSVKERLEFVLKEVGHKRVKP